MMGKLVRIGRPILIFCSGFAMSNFGQSDSQIIFSDERVPAGGPAFRIAQVRHLTNVCPLARAREVERADTIESRGLTPWCVWTNRHCSRNLGWVHCRLRALCR